MSEQDNQTIAEEIQFVIFTLGTEEFGIEINQVREIVRLPSITHLPKAPSFIEGVINLRGEVLAVMDLAKRYQLSSTEKTEQARIIIVEISGRSMGLIVDSVKEVMRININDIQPAPEVTQSKIQKNFIEGVGKVDDKLIVLVNLKEILTLKEKDAISEVQDSQMEDSDNV